MKTTLPFTVIALFLITACQNNENTSRPPEVLAIINQDSLDKRNKRIAVECIRAYERGDVDFILAHNANDVVNFMEGRPPQRGIDSMKIGLREFRNTFKEYKSSNELALADNNYVFVYQNWDGSLKADSTRQTYHFRAVEIFKFNPEGKIIQHASMQEQLSPNAKDYFNKE